MDEERIRYVLTCQRCFRIYKNFVPVPDKKSIAVVWCNVCNVIIGRFDWGKKEYE